jgi:hypothetical protein
MDGEYKPITDRELEVRVVLLVEGDEGAGDDPAPFRAVSE